MDQKWLGGGLEGDQRTRAGWKRDRLGTRDEPEEDRRVSGKEDGAGPEKDWRRTREGDWRGTKGGPEGGGEDLSTG